MNIDDFRGRRLIVVANEAGGGSLLAALMFKWQPAPDSIVVASDTAVPYFMKGTLLIHTASSVLDTKNAIALIEAIQPEWVIVGTSAFASIEKIFMMAAQTAGTPFAAFVDHYWNLWQRFAHEETAERWFYQLFTHPLLQQAATSNAGRSREEVMALLDLPEAGPVVLFVSEYGFPESEKWQWEQAPVGDLEQVLEAVLHACSKSGPSAGCKRTVLIKLHPAQVDFPASIFSKYSSASYRMVRQFDKQELFAVSDLAIGLDSMLLLEASWAGLPTYSYHASGVGRGRWLSDIHPEICELHSASACAKVIDDAPCPARR
ncbi:MAG: hypothetical protein NT123_25435 [Proteobacteria bacterium]|nr:hypothetical protein [Pseudomonadota bacterium]